MESINKLIEEAKVLLSKKKFQEAKILFKNIIKIDPNHYKSFTNIGVICIKLSELKEAEENLNEAIKINNFFEIAYYNLGKAKEKLGKKEEAKKNFLKAINLDPNYVDAYASLGTLHLGEDDLNNAEKYLKKAIELKPNFSKAHYNLGLTQSKKNRYDLAELNYRNALEHNPNFEDATHNLKKILRQNELLYNIEQNKKINSNCSSIQSGLSKNPYLYNRQVEPELISELYKIQTEKLDDTRDARYGNGICSDYELFKNNINILKIVEKDLIKIMSQSVNSNIFIIESFFNILRTGSGLTSHNHINEFDQKNNLINKKYSLTYYLSVGDQKTSEPGILKIYDPIIEILPSNGSIIIFPAGRKHSISYNGTTERVMIGVNFYALS